jgi:putative spermidine/putrescine transport system ATP-binding protein
MLATGRVESIVYLGAATRYAVALDGGGSLTVLHQNADDRDYGPAAGARVRLAWQPRHQQRLGGQRA